MDLTLKNVDEQVVRMSFDNNKFNNNIKDTENALDNLDKRLCVLEKNNALNKMSNDMSGLASTFSKSGIIMFGVLNKLGSELASLGKRIASTLTSGIRDGLAEYNLQIDATQTILSNIKDEGKGIEDVTDALDELNRYADQTIYNFSEMTKNIGMFTAAGTKLDTSVSTIKGLANAAAIVGANSSTASRAWYQVSQAMAAGTFKLMDWRSLEVSNIAGEQFQEVIKEVARATKATDKHGRNIDQMIKKYGSLRDTLKEGWLTADRFSEAMSILSGDIDDKTLRKKGYTEKQIKKLRSIANEAIEAATAVKTFKQLLQTVAESIGSGWAETFRTIIGDIEQAKDLFTSINNILSDFIEKGQVIRKFIVKKIFEDDNGRNKLKEVFDNTLTSFSALYRALRAGWMNIFSIDRIRSAASKMIDFMTKTSEALTINQKSDYANLSDAEKKEKGLKGLDKTSKWNHEVVTKAIQNVIRIGRGAASAIDIVWSSIKQLASYILNKIPFFRDFYKNLKEGNEGLLSSAGKVADVITTIRNMIVNEQLITKLLEAVENKIKSIIKNNPALQMLVSFIKWIRDNLKNAFNIIKTIDFSGVIKAFNDIKTIIRQILNTVISTDVFQSIVDIVKMLLGFGKDILKGFGSFLSGFAQTIDKTDGKTKDLLSTVVKVSAAFVLLKNIIAKMPDIAFLIYKLNIPQLFRYVTKYLKARAFVETSEAIRNIAMSVALLSGALLVLSIIPFDTLIERFSLLAVGIGLFTLAIRSLGGGISVVEVALDAISDFARASVFTSIALSMVFIVAAMGLIKKMFPNPKELRSYIGSMVTLLIALAAAVFLVTKAMGNFGTTLGGVIKILGVKSIISSVVGAILTLTIAIGVLSLIPEEKLAKAITAIVAISLIVTSMIGVFSLLSGLHQSSLKIIAAVGMISSVLSALTFCLIKLSLITAIPNVDLYEAAITLSIMGVIVVALSGLIGKIRIISDIGNITKSIIVLTSVVGLLWALSSIIAVVAILPKNNLEPAISAITGATANIISLMLALTLVSKYINNPIATVAILTVLFGNLIGLVAKMSTIAVAFKHYEVDFKHIGMAGSILVIALAAIAASISELVLVSKIIQKNAALFTDIGRTFVVIGGVLSFISLISAELVLMSIALKNVTWKEIIKSGTIFATSIASVALIVKSFSTLSIAIKSIGSIASLAALAGLSSAFVTLTAVMAAAMTGVAIALRDVSWGDLAKSGAAFVAGSGIFIGVIAALISVSKLLLADKLAIFSYLTISISINAFIISVSASLLLISSSIKKLSNVNITSNVVSMLKLYGIIIGLFIGVALLMQKMPKKVTFSFLSLSVALLVLSVFAETLAKIINGMLKYSEQMPEMGEKIGVSIGNFCLGVVNTLKNAIPALVKSLVHILYVFVESIWENVPTIADVIGKAIAAIFVLAFKIATTRITLENGMTIHTGLILEMFAINKIVKVLTGTSVVSKLATAFGSVLKIAFVNTLGTYGITMASTWSQILTMMLYKLGLFGKGVTIIGGQVQLTMRTIATAAGNLLIIGASAVAAFGVASAAVHAWRQYCHQELTYNNADIMTYEQAFQAIFTDSAFRTQVFAQWVYDIAELIGLAFGFVLNIVTSVFRIIVAGIQYAISGVKNLGNRYNLIKAYTNKAKDPKNAEYWDKEIEKYKKLIAENEKASDDTIERMKLSWQAWGEVWNHTGEGLNWGEWESKGSKAGTDAATSFTSSFQSAYMSNMAGMNELFGITTKELSEEQEKAIKDFNFKVYKEQYGLDKAILKLASLHKDELVGLNKEQAEEILRQKIEDAGVEADLAAKASKSIVANLMTEKYSEKVITEEAAKSLVQTEADTTATIIDIREYANRRLEEQLEEEYKMKKEAARASARIRELEAKGLANLTIAEREEYKHLINQQKLFEDKRKKFLSENPETYDRARIAEIQRKGMGNLTTAEREELKALQNRVKNGSYGTSGSSSSNDDNWIAAMWKQLQGMYNRNGAGNPDDSLFNAEDLKKQLEALLKKMKNPKNPKNPKDPIKPVKNLKNDLEAQRADLTPIIDLDKLQSDANKASQIVTTSLLAAQNAAIGDYINNDSELNPFMKDRWQNVYNFTQNNYSPKALSRIDIYRQTQRQLSMSRGF